MLFAREMWLSTATPDCECCTTLSECSRALQGDIQGLAATASLVVGWGGETGHSLMKAKMRENRRFAGRVGENEPRVHIFF